MNSKMSIATKSKKKKVGGVGGADSKIVSELQLNVKKLLEDVRKLRVFEHESGLTFRKNEHTFDELKLKNDLFQIEHEKIKKRQDEIQNEHSNAMSQLGEKTKKVEKIYKDMLKLINDFKKEYRYGFKKIIKAEVDISDLKNQVKFVRNKLIPKNEQKQLNKEDLIKEIDGKFEILYGQVATMATDQAQFNTKIQNDQNKLQEPLEIEISRIRQEGELMMRELERTQNANRELINSVVFSSKSERSPPKNNRTFMNHSSTAVSSTRGRKKHNLSINEDISNPVMKDQIRYSTPSVSAVAITRLKRFNFAKKNIDDSIPGN